MAFLNRGDAMDALVAANNTDGCDAVLLYCLPEEAEWQEATHEQVEDADRYLWQIVDAGGNTVLVPRAAYDANEDYDDLDAPAPDGYLWVVP
jgi:hypothetical protein